MKKKEIKQHDRKLNKIIYFDDGSVTDYIQIIEGGKLTKTTALLNSDNGSGEADINTDASIGISGIFRSLIGFGANAQVKTNLNTSFKNETLVTTILQNTILTDFLDLINDKETSIKIFDKIYIKIIKDSLSYIIMVAPYMKMLKDGTIKLNSDLDFSLDMVKIDDTIKSAKGYFEFEGVTENGSVILRFNIESFKNNYKISDLLKMNLTIYAVPVGKIKKENLTMISELNAATSDNSPAKANNPHYGEEAKDTETDEENQLIVYDVLLAGVEQND